MMFRDVRYFAGTAAVVCARKASRPRHIHTARTSCSALGEIRYTDYTQFFL